MDRGVTVTSSRIERWQLKPGDHIYAWRKNGANMYSHHGIYESHEKVIHFNPSGVDVCSLDRFLGGDELRLFAYGVPEWFYNASSISFKPQITCTMEAEDPPETVLRRANDPPYHGDFKFGRDDYDVLVNNCMAFAFYCKTGRRYYDLVKRVSGATQCMCEFCQKLTCLNCRNGRFPPARGPPSPPPQRRPRSRSPPRRRRSGWLQGLGRVVEELPQPSLNLKTVCLGVGLGVALVVAPEFAPLALL